MIPLKESQSNNDSNHTIIKYPPPSQLPRRLHHVQKERQGECRRDPRPVDCSGILTMLRIWRTTITAKKTGSKWGSQVTSTFVWPPQKWPQLDHSVARKRDKNQYGLIMTISFAHQPKQLWSWCNTLGGNTIRTTASLFSTELWSPIYHQLVANSCKRHDRIAPQGLWPHCHQLSIISVRPIHHQLICDCAMAYLPTTKL
jgi:hypothetical protein